MPGVIIGLSVLLIYLIIDPFLPIPIYGTLWIIVIAMTTQYISLGDAADERRDRADQARARGGGRCERRVVVAAMRRIVLPLIRPAFINGFLLVFLQAIKNLTLALILISPTRHGGLDADLPVLGSGQYRRDRRPRRRDPRRSR